MGGSLSLTEDDEDVVSVGFRFKELTNDGGGGGGGGLLVGGGGRAFLGNEVLLPADFIAKSASFVLGVKEGGGREEAPCFPLLVP